MQYTEAGELKGMLKKPHKYGAATVVDAQGKRRWIEVDGVKFQSQREAKRWIALNILANEHAITNLRRQVRYELIMKTHYVSDFEYDDVANGQHVVEDSKGFLTETYKRKKKLMRQQHGVEIREV